MYIIIVNFVKILTKISKKYTMAKKHDIIWLESVESTNDEARKHISDLDNLSVLSAYRQTAGRGQRGNTWSSKAGQNLTFTIILKSGDTPMSEIRAIDQFAISEIAALSVTDLLASHGIEAKVKWPNDIYVGDRKICGILIENSVRDGMLSSSLVGIGLNVNQTRFPDSLPNPTSMLLINPDNEGIVLSPLLERFMDIFKSYCRRYLNITGGLNRLRMLYLGQIWHKDMTARYIDNSDGHVFTGIIRGISEIGHLLVEDTEKGELREFAFKEISYIV